jgi:hypothetical protein
MGNICLTQSCFQGRFPKKFQKNRKGPPSQHDMWSQNADHISGNKILIGSI